MAFNDPTRTVRADQLKPGDRIKPVARQLPGVTVVRAQPTPDGSIEISWGRENRSVVSPDKTYEVFI